MSKTTGAGSAGGGGACWAWSASIRAMSNASLSLVVRRRIHRAGRGAREISRGIIPTAPLVLGRSRLCMSDYSPARFPAAIIVIFILSLVSPLGTMPTMWAQAQRRPAAAAAPAYYPGRFDWQKQTAEQARIDAAKLDAAIKFASANENPATKDLAVDLATTFGREPFDTPIGPVKPRGALSGIIIKNGYIVAEWGETTRVDMTFSVTKTFLSTVVGLMSQKGLIRDVTDLVKDYMPPGDAAALFDGPHNSKITWEHLLRQTSDWQGTIWGKPDWADRPEGQTPADWPNRKLSEPGHALQIQRRPRQRPRARRAARAAPAAARIPARRDHGADRRLEHLALVWLRELVGRSSTDGGCSR